MKARIQPIDAWLEDVVFESAVMSCARAHRDYASALDVRRVVDEMHPTGDEEASEPIFLYTEDVPTERTSLVLHALREVVRRGDLAEEKIGGIAQFGLPAKHRVVSSTPIGTRVEIIHALYETKRIQTTTGSRVVTCEDGQLLVHVEGSPFPGFSTTSFSGGFVGLTWVRGKCFNAINVRMLRKLDEEGKADP